MKEMTVAMESYLEIIYEYSLNKQKVRVSDIAKELNVSKPSVNNAVNVLTKNGYVINERYADIKLTNKGIEYAKFICSKHQIIQELFIRVLNIDEITANHDACLIEHIISDESLLKMEEFLKKLNK